MVNKVARKEETKEAQEVGDVKGEGAGRCRHQ